MTDRELMQKAADKLSIMVGYPGLCLYHEDFSQVLAAIRERLAQPEQEPVAHCEAGPDHCPVCLKELSPAQRREWQGLTDEEFQWIYDNGRTPAGMIEMVEAKLREKNNG